MRFAIIFLLVACSGETRTVFVSTGRPAPTDPTPSSTPYHPIAHVHAKTCGEGALERAWDVALGKGDKHPDVIALDAMLAKCPDKTPTAEECAAVTREHVEFQTRYGPQHPYMLASNAKLALCNQH